MDPEIILSSGGGGGGGGGGDELAAYIREFVAFNERYQIIDLKYPVHIPRVYLISFIETRLKQYSCHTRALI